MSRPDFSKAEKVRATLHRLGDQEYKTLAEPEWRGPGNYPHINADRTEELAKGEFEKRLRAPKDGGQAKAV